MITPPEDTLIIVVVLNGSVVVSMIVDVLMIDVVVSLPFPGSTLHTLIGRAIDLEGEIV